MQKSVTPRLHVVLVCGLLLALSPTCLAGSLDPGVEVFAVDPTRVLEISIRTSLLRVIAHRWDKNDSFFIMVLERNGKLSTCNGSKGFRTVLEGLVSLKLKRTLDTTDSSHDLKIFQKERRAEVEIRDDSELDPFRAVITPIQGSGAEALVQFNGANYVVGVDAKVFELIAAGCKGLSGPRR